MINIERKRGHYGCVRRESWDTCTVCNTGKQQECEFYMTCTKWADKCEPENCYKCEVYINRNKPQLTCELCGTTGDDVIVQYDRTAKPMNLCRDRVNCWTRWDERWLNENKTFEAYVSAIRVGGRSLK